MSQWNVGQAGGVPNQAGLAASLMLRFGGDAASAVEPVEARGARRQPAESFSQILKDHTSRNTEGPRQPERRPSSVHRGQLRAANRAASGSDFPGREPLRSSRSIAELDQADPAVAGPSPERPTTGSPVLDKGETLSKTSTEDVAPVPSLEEASVPETDDADATVLAMLLQALQTILEDLSGQVSVSGDEAVQADGETPLPTEMAGGVMAQLPQEFRQWLHAAVQGLSDDVSTPAIPLPEPLKALLAELLPQDGGTAVNPSALVTPTEDTGLTLLAQLQALSRSLRDMLQQGMRQTDGDLAALSPDDLGPDTAVPVMPAESDESGKGQDASGQAEHKPSTLSPAFAVAHPEADAAADVAALARGTGVHEAAMAGGRQFGQHVAQAARAGGAAPAPSPMAPETSRFITQQVTTRLATISGDERHEMELQLKPESLGKIQLRIVEERGQILARFTAESERVRAILESNMQLLRDALEKNGMQIQELSVSIGQRQAQQSGEDGTGQTRDKNPVRTGSLIRSASLAEGLSGTDAGVRLSRRVREYLYGPDSTMSLRA
jgi:flagellar hook-length control protein FliK